MIPGKLDIQLYRAATHTITIDVDNSLGAPFEIVGTNQLRIYRNYNEAAILTVSLTWNGTALVGTLDTDDSDIEAGSYPYHLWNVNGAVEQPVIRGMVEVADVYVGNFVDVDGSVVVDSVTYQVTVTGIGTTEATLVNVKDYGATGDGVTDDTAAIQAAVDGSTGDTLFFPDGTYIITDTIKINSDYTSLLGSGRRSVTLIMNTPDKDLIWFCPDNASVGTTRQFSNFVSRMTLKIPQGLGPTGHDAACIKFTKCYRYGFNDIYFETAALAFHLIGSSTGTFDNWYVVASSSGTYLGVGSSVIKMNDLQLADLSYLQQWVVTFSNFQITNLELVDAEVWSSVDRESLILCQRADGWTMNNGKFGNCYVAHIKFLPSHAAAFISNIFGSNLYFDGFSHKYSLWTPANAYNINAGYSFSNFQMKGSIASVFAENTGNARVILANGTFGRSALPCASAIDVDGAGIRINIAGCDFNQIGGVDGKIKSVTDFTVTLYSPSHPVATNEPDWATDFVAGLDFTAGGVTKTILSSAGNVITFADAHAYTAGQSFVINNVTPVIQANNIDSLTLKGNIFNDSTAKIVGLSGTINNVNITGNTNNTDIIDIDNQATVGMINIGNNISNYTGAKTNNWTSYYGTFTPEIYFLTSAGTTPPTYAVQEGSFSIANCVITFRIRIDLSNQGDGTGTIRIFGIPEQPPDETTNVQCNIANMDAAYTGGYIARATVLIANNRAEISLVNIVDFVSIRDDHITNTTRFLVSGQYIVK